MKECRCRTESKRVTCWIMIYDASYVHNTTYARNMKLWKWRREKFALSLINRNEIKLYER
jgi:hypothetical protein